MRTSDLEYELPDGVIATRPAEPRDSARMLVVSRSDPRLLLHQHVRDLPAHLKAGDLLVFNRTRVLAARLIGVNDATGGRVEGLFLHEAVGPSQWQVLVKARRARPGAVLTLLDASDQETDVTLTLLERAGDEEGGWIAQVRVGGEPMVAGMSGALLVRVGRTPLPPYILAARRTQGVAVPDAEDQSRYQTVYADTRQSGSVAAPTAGLHFTPALLARLDQLGIARGDVVLHVGTGTFRPVEAEYLTDHPMHTEWCTMEKPLADRIHAVRQTGTGRVIAVGTTSVRTLESYATVHVEARWPADVRTRLLIAPGHRFRWVNGMLTNFHLPRSTLLALVAASFERDGEPGSGIARVREIYGEAIRKGYRFYSYGDAMLILP